MMVDYGKVCGACSTPLTSPPRDGAGSICALLHTPQGRAMFGRILEGNLRKKALIDAVTSSPIPPEVATLSGDLQGGSGDFSPSGDAKVVTEDEVVTDAVTLDDDHPLLSETKQQRYRRLNRERVNERERDRRNSHGGDGVL